MTKSQWLPQSLGANFARRSAAMTSLDRQQPALSTKAKSNVIPILVIALTAAAVLLVCYVFVRNTDRVGEQDGRQPAELPDTVSPDRAHSAR
jgi:flagellar basal body-associated protein FliL